MTPENTTPLARIKQAITVIRPKPDPPDTPISHQTAIDIMACARRRQAIEILAGKPADASISISDLAEHVAALENDCSVEELSSQQRERVYIALYQRHLSQMRDIVDYSEDRGTIVPTEAPERLWSAYQTFCAQLDG